MKLIKCYGGKETEVEYSDSIAVRLLTEKPYDENSKNATFKQVEGEEKLAVGKKAEIVQIIPQTTFSPEEGRKILEAKKYKDLKALYATECGEKAPNNIKKVDLINAIMEKSNG